MADFDQTRARFRLPDGLVYLDGNSLGALPVGVEEAVADAVRRQWGQDLVGSWTTAGWWEAPLRIGGTIGRLVGAEPGSVVVTDSTSVDLFKLIVAAIRLCRARPGPPRDVIVVDEATFPTDRYIVDEAARLLGLQVRPAAPDDGAALDESVALAVFCHVDFRTGVLYDLPAITAAVHGVGALALWDVCHSAGALPVDLADAEVDLAVGCSYKYLNGGPGAPAWAYVAPRWQPEIDSPLPGWNSHRDPFAMQQRFEPVDGIGRLRTGTPPMLSMVALEAALRAFDGVEIDQVRARSLELTSLLIELVDSVPGCDVEVVTPREPARRGSQVSLRHPDAFPIVQALIARGVVGDFRAPDVIRLGVAPLYIGRADVERAVQQLAEVISTGEFRRPEFAVRATVT